jgi:hypothetical protein
MYCSSSAPGSAPTGQRPPTAAAAPTGRFVHTLQKVRLLSFCSFYRKWYTAVSTTLALTSGITAVVVPNPVEGPVEGIPAPFALHTPPLPPPRQLRLYPPPHPHLHPPLRPPPSPPPSPRLPQPRPQTVLPTKAHAPVNFRVKWGTPAALIGKGLYTTTRIYATAASSTTVRIPPHQPLLRRLSHQPLLRRLSANLLLPPHRWI